MKIEKQKQQVIILYVATLLGTQLGIIASIINTRYLNPLDYGDVRYVQNIINFISSLLLFGYFLSGSRLLALSKSKKDSQQIRGIMIIILGVSIGILMLSTLTVSLLHYKQEQVANLFFLSIPVCAFPLLSNYINTTAQGDNHIGRLAVSRVLPDAYISTRIFF